jgi:hypothetical protein
MAVATSKALLIAVSRHDRKVYTHPVAIFGKDAEAKSYATFLRLAHRANDKEAFLALDPKSDLTAEGELIKDTKWSILVLPYAPTPNFGEEDDAASEDAVTS